MASAQQRQSGLRQQPLVLWMVVGALPRHGQQAGVDAVARGGTV